jgi:sodium-dependent dicarboxylate transporter 2/3/5
MKRWMLLIGPLVATALGILLRQYGLSPAIGWTGGVTALCAMWWITEPIPIPATSLIPLALFPVVGVLTPAQVGEAYGSPLVLLMLGGFMLSTAMERSGAHRRIALFMVALFGGTSGRRLVFGFMSASALLSMWLSNSGTTIMLLPIALAVMEKLDSDRVKTSLLLGIAYAASVGGIGTPIGTPPNLVFMEVYEQNTGIEPTFLQWMKWSLPIVFLMLPVTAFWLTRRLPKIAPVTLPSVGAWRAEEIRTLLVFLATATLWVTRKQPYGGWSGALGLDQANDASVALLAVVALFMIPNGKGKRLLDWKTASKIEWGILILFGGGIAIAKAFTASKLAAALGVSLAEIGNLPLIVMLGMICLTITFLTEVTSNTATTTLVLPILAAAAASAQIDPKLMMVPATISASFAFMLPVATAPNAIVFGGTNLDLKTMAREGFALNLIGAVIISAVCLVMFG